MFARSDANRLSHVLILLREQVLQRLQLQALLQSFSWRSLKDSSTPTPHSHSLNTIKSFFAGLHIIVHKLMGES
jgi:hypothetical protein